MKKKLSLVMALVFVIGVGSMAFADGFKTPAEIYSELKNITVEQAYEEVKENDKSFGQLAEDNGFLDKFRDQNQEERKAMLKQYVEEGKLTQEQADAMLERMDECLTDGPLGRQGGMRAGNGLGCELREDGERGLGQGRGRGNGRGKGMGLGRNISN